ncbi:unnamed protein product, partial [Pylaiella littoralis]
MEDWCLPKIKAEKFLLSQQFDTFEFKEGEDPRIGFAAFAQLEATMRACGCEKSEEDTVHVLLRQLPDSYDMEKRGQLAIPNLTRSFLESVVRSSYATRKANALAKQRLAAAAPAVTSNPHALAVGRAFGGGGHG